MRLDKYLADCGLGTRSELKSIIKKGNVRVSDTVVKDPSFSVSQNDRVLFCGKEIKYTPYVYLMMNKPKGVVCATEDKHCKTVLDLVGDEYRNFDLFPVGRLDIDTEGLLILTNDGELAHKALSPTHHVEKTYYVETEREIEPSASSVFEEGFYIPGGHKTLPAQLEITGTKTALVTLCEGKFHQVKFMFEHIGNRVVYLKRIKFGKTVLDDTLIPGEYRPLKSDETIF